MKTGGFMIRIVIADDHPLIREGLSALLKGIADIELVYEAADGVALMDSLSKFDVDVVIVDLQMPQLSGLEALRKIKAARPNIKVIVLTIYNDAQKMKECIDAGADAYILKEDALEETVTAIEAVLAGRIKISENILQEREENEAALRAKIKKLTKREREIAEMTAQGKTDEQIAEALNITVRTIQNTRAAAYKKLGIRTKAELTRKIKDL